MATKLKAVVAAIKMPRATAVATRPKVKAAVAATRKAKAMTKTPKAAVVAIKTLKAVAVAIKTPKVAVVAIKTLKAVAVATRPKPKRKTLRANAAKANAEAMPKIAILASASKDKRLVGNREPFFVV